ncbi:MAG: antibiotic biosynthesis monooxygenase [Gammaproteobacteria bacterium]|nr:MAG: antibiotic biosynthesis monooxygenase [Gammaproteobacteria bacterium]
MELSQDAGPVTMSIARTVVPGRERDYEEWLKGITADAVKYPGHMGVNVLRPTGSSSEYVAIFRFDSYEHLCAWQASPERKSWLASLEGLVEGEDRVQKSMGMEYWFSLPELPDSQPSPHKMALVLFVVVLCLVLLLNVTFYPFMSEWPLLARTGVTVLFQVVLMTYVVMPRVTRILKPWLYGKPG